MKHFEVKDWRRFLACVSSALLTRTQRILCSSREGTNEINNQRLYVTCCPQWTASKTLIGWSHLTYIASRFGNKSFAVRLRIRATSKCMLYPYCRRTSISHSVRSYCYRLYYYYHLLKIAHNKRTCVHDITKWSYLQLQAIKTGHTKEN